MQREAREFTGVCVCVGERLLFEHENTRESSVHNGPGQRDRVKTITYGGSCRAGVRKCELVGCARVEKNIATWIGYVGEIECIHNTSTHTPHTPHSHLQCTCEVRVSECMYNVCGSALEHVDVRGERVWRRVNHQGAVYHDVEVAGGFRCFSHCTQKTTSPNALTDSLPPIDAGMERKNAFLYTFCLLYIPRSCAYVHTPLDPAHKVKTI